MRAAQPHEGTVKCRIGVDDQDPREALPRFIEAMRAAVLTGKSLDEEISQLIGR